MAFAPWPVRLLLMGRFPRRTPYDLPLVLFLLTAGVGVLVAFDRDGSLSPFDIQVGWRKLWGLILAVSIFYALASMETEEQRRWTVRLLAAFGTGVGGWFLLTNDWTANPAHWDLITRLGQGIQSFLPSVPGHRLNANVAGGLIALLFPTGLEMVGKQQQGGWGWRLGGGAGLLIMGLGLLLTTSRGAWLAAGGGAALAIVWWLAGRLASGHRRWAAFAALILGAGLALGLAVALIPTLRTAVRESDALANRLSIYYQTSLLVRDYAFTGCGLGNFPSVYSTYALLIHVPIIGHSHALLLDLAVGQGVFGVLAMLIVWGEAIWLGGRALTRERETPSGLLSGLLSLAVLILHGLGDNVPYGTRGLLLMWVPVGLIAAAVRSGPPSLSMNRRRRWIVTAGMAVGLLLALLLLARPLIALGYANRGAVSQTLVELSQYDYNHFDNPTLDQIRQRADLSDAEAYFERALALDPGQVTARTRLTQIALARGEYDAALAHMEAAWDAGHRDRVTRLLLGDCLAAHGRVEEAAEVVQGLEWAAGRLAGQAFYRYWVNEEWQRAAYAWRTVTLLEPDNEHARLRAEQAEERARRGP